MKSSVRGDGSVAADPHACAVGEGSEMASGCMGSELAVAPVEHLLRGFIPPLSGEILGE